MDSNVKARRDEIQKALSTITDDSVAEALVGVQVSEETLEKAVAAGELQVFSQDSLNRYSRDLQKAFDRKLISKDDLEKGQRDLSKLVKVQKTDRNGKKITVWVKRGEEPHQERQPAQQEQPKANTEGAAKPDMSADHKALLEKKTQLHARVKQALQNEKDPDNHAALLHHANRLEHEVGQLGGGGGEKKEESKVEAKPKVVGIKNRIIGKEPEAKTEPKKEKLTGSTKTKAKLEEVKEQHQKLVDYGRETGIRSHSALDGSWRRLHNAQSAHRSESKKEALEATSSAKSPEDHKKAADLHRQAAQAYRETNGSWKKIGEHEEKAKEHDKLASSEEPKKEAPSTPAAPKGDLSKNAIDTESKITNEGKRSEASLNASEHDIIATAHQKAADAHEKKGNYDTLKEYHQARADRHSKLAKEKGLGAWKDTPKPSETPKSTYESYTQSKEEGAAVISRQKNLIANPKSPEGVKKRAQHIIDVESKKHGIKVDIAGMKGHRDMMNTNKGNTTQYQKDQANKTYGEAKKRHDDMKNGGDSTEKKDSIKISKNEKGHTVAELNGKKIYINHKGGTVGVNGYESDGQAPIGALSSPSSNKNKFQGIKYSHAMNSFLSNVKNGMSVKDAFYDSSKKMSPVQSSGRVRNTHKEHLESMLDALGIEYK